MRPGSGLEILWKLEPASHANEGNELYVRAEERKKAYAAKGKVRAPRARAAAGMESEMGPRRAASVTPSRAVRALTAQLYARAAQA